jgi:pyruvate dehydrogenase E2 component (dihydrolipoamide acetyltransferase)
MKILETISIEQDNVNDESVIIKNLYFETGDYVEKDSLLIDYETSKASHEIFSTESGYLEYLCELEDVVDVGDKIVNIYDEKVDEVQMSKKDGIENSPIFSKKAMAKLNELGLKMELFSEYDNVTESLVTEIYNKNKYYSEVQKLSPTKREEIKNLFNSDRATLISTVAKDINSRTLDLDIIYEHPELNNSLLPVIIEQVSRILDDDESMKLLNSFCEGDEVYVYKAINAGIALNFGDGLRVGVIKDANNSSLSEIEEALLGLIDKYIERKLSTEDISDATFTITDLTDQNIDSFIPLIKNKNSMMLGICGSKNGVQHISITFDHRVTDGLFASKLLNLLLDNLSEKYGGVIGEYSCVRCLQTFEDLIPENSLHGLVAIVNDDGSNGYICQICLAGY